MSRYLVHTNGVWGLACCVAAIWLVDTVRAEPSAKRVTAMGEVNADAVYVRSGPSTNHYTICKLSAGDRVSIVGEQGGWLEILPPQDTFSLISGDYVDSADERNGVVNGENVRVRAGSTLNKSKYTIQTMLSKGAEVVILGRNPDGFLRIAPPDGATMWISAEFVERVSDGASAPMSSAPESTNRSDADEANDTSDAGDGAKLTVVSAKKSPDEPDSPAAQSDSFTGLPSSGQRAKLTAIDTATQAELLKPALERELQPLLDRYRAIADQEDDKLARQYAATRVKQVADMMALLDTVRGIRALNQQAASTRRSALDGRSRIPRVAVPIPSSIDVKGVLRWSALYPPDSVPQRVRIVESSSDRERTIAYVEIPVNLAVDLETMIGHFVGVRAASRRWQEGGVDPIPIYVARELVLMDANRAVMSMTPGN